MVNSPAIPEPFASDAMLLLSESLIESVALMLISPASPLIVDADIRLLNNSKEFKLFKVILPSVPDSVVFAAISA